jgi:hypothetical protein
MKIYASEIIKNILEELEVENPLNNSVNFLSRVLLYLTDPPHYFKNREKWGSTLGIEKKYENF